MKRLVIAVLALMFSCAASASTPWDHWQQVGRATLTWGPFKVYHSALLTPDGKYQAQNWPQALAIDYLRSIDRQELAKATADQWQALGMSDVAQKNGWMKAVENIWPDVREGSEIVFVADQRGGQFYSRAPDSVIVSPIGKPFSPEFRDAFLAIWLSPATQYPDLRSKLTGNTTSD